MKRAICFMVLFGGLLFTACTKDNFIHTGTSKGRFEGSLMEYMEAHPYDWSYMVEFVRHSGEDMVQLFEGKDPEHKEISFLGITNHSIRRYLLTEGKTIADLDPEWCRGIILQHVIDGKIYRKDVVPGEPSEYETLGTGGTIYTTLAGTQVWIYTIIPEAGGVTENTARPIYLNFLKSNEKCNVASGDIEPDNCVVHALEYAFTLGQEE